MDNRQATEEKYRPIKRLPLTIVVTGTGVATEGKLDAVMTAELDALEGYARDLAVAVAEARRVCQEVIDVDNRGVLHEDRSNALHDLLAPMAREALGK